MALIKNHHHHHHHRRTGSARAMTLFLRVTTTNHGSAGRCLSLLSAALLLLVVAFVTQSHQTTTWNNRDERQQPQKAAATVSVTAKTTNGATKATTTTTTPAIVESPTTPANGAPTTTTTATITKTSAIVESSPTTSPPESLLTWDAIVDQVRQRVRNMALGDFSSEAQRQACFSLGSIPAWILQLRPALEEQVFSQFGEDGITKYILQNLAPSSLLPTPATTSNNNKNEKYYVEFGVQDGAECNTRMLREHYNWTGLLMDGGFEIPRIGLQQEMIHPDTVVALFQKYQVPQTFGLLSEDTDYADYYIWQSILQAGYRPRVLIGEINSNFLGSSSSSSLATGAAAATEPQPQYYDLESESVTVQAPPLGKARLWDHTDYFGVSALALKRLWNKYGYIMIYCTEKQINCFGIHESDLLLPQDENKNNDNNENENDVFRIGWAAAAAQECLWHKPMTWPRKLHPCNTKFESYTHVDVNGNLVTNSTIHPLVVQYCRKRLQPRDFVKVKVGNEIVV